MFGIDVGPSSGELGATKELTGESGFAGAVGEGLIGDSSAFIEALLSGNQGKIAELLAPQTSEIAKRANQKTQTNAQFGSRSGGTNASNQNTMDQARSSVNDMVSKLTGSAIGEGASLGSDLLGKSMSGYNDVFQQNAQEQAQRAAMWDDIFKSSAQAAGAVGGMFPASSTFGKDLSSFGAEFGG